MIGVLHLYKQDKDRSAGGRHDEIDVELSSQAPGVISWDTYRDDNWKNDYRQNAMHRGDFTNTHRIRGLEAFDSTRFNTYVIDWRPHRVTWLINGIPIASASEAVPTMPMEIRLDVYYKRAWNAFLGIKPAGTGGLEIRAVSYTPYHATA